MTTTEATRVGMYGGILTLAGVVVSGPLGLAIVAAVHPSPNWQGAQAFAANYHPIQTLPFFGGFALLTGCLMVIASIYRIAPDTDKTRCLVAVMLTAAFATLIFFNYVNQTTFVPDMARHYRPEFDPIITALSLANPHSMSWAIEMWGYALFGVATWLVAPVFNRNRLERAAGAALVANGVLSIPGGFVTAYNLGWVFSGAGLVSYGAWNAVVAVVSILVVLSLRDRARLAQPPTLPSVRRLTPFDSSETQRR